MSSYGMLVLTTGLALFSMFFGSGNLVYPLAVGVGAGDQAGWGTLGLLCTAVGMPLAGCIGILLYGGTPQRFFGFLGQRGFRLLALISLGLMGPFGVLARCLTVAHGTVVGAGWEVSAVLFSLASCLLLWIAAFYRQAILQLLGAWLTPLLLLALFTIVTTALGQSDQTVVAQVATSTSSWQAFSSGVHEGYQMMDLLAAFFFSGFVIAQIKEKLSSSAAEYSLVKLFLQASILAGVLLALVYTALVYLGASYSSLLADVPPQNMLAVITHTTLGSWGGAIACATFVLACYTTALVLTVLFADFLRTELSGERLPNWLTLLITLAIAFFTSTLEFSGIASMLAPLMETIYPLLIAITAWNIGLYLWSAKKCDTSTLLSPTECN